MVDSGCGGRGQVTGLVYFVFDTLFVLREYREMSVCLTNFLLFFLLMETSRGEVFKVQYFLSREIRCWRNYNENLMESFVCGFLLQIKNYF